MSNRIDRIPTFIEAASPLELRSFFDPVNTLTGEMHNYKVMQDIKTKKYIAWFYADLSRIQEIDLLINEIKKRRKK